MESNPFFEKPLIKRKRNWPLIVLESLVVITSIGIVLYLFIFSPNQVDGPSMEPNFYTNQLYFANKLVEWFDGTEVGNITGFKYKRGDVIVLQIPDGRPAYIKRIIGMPGERVAIREGYVYINNKKLIEDYLPPATYTKGADLLEDGGESVLVPNNNFIVIGDHRSVSHDSRYKDVGLIKKEWVKGRVFLRFYPLDTFGIIPTGKFTLLEN